MAAVQAEVRRIADGARPAALAGEQVLPVLDGLKALLPWGGLRRGAPVAVSGGAGLSLALALAAGASSAGSWVGVLGIEGLGLVAAAELGLDLDRLLMVGRPPRASWAGVADAIVGATDVVLLGVGGWAGAGQVRRLAARARDAGAVLLAVSGSRQAGGEADLLGSELQLRADPGRWLGLDQGHGHLAARELVVDARGRRGADRPRRMSLWFVGVGDRVEVTGSEPGNLSLPGPDEPTLSRAAQLSVIQGELAG